MVLESPLGHGLGVGAAPLLSAHRLTFLLGPEDIAPTNSSPHSQQLNIYQPLDLAGGSKSLGMLQVGPLQSDVTVGRGESHSLSSQFPGRQSLEVLAFFRRLPRVCLVLAAAVQVS